MTLFEIRNKLIENIICKVIMIVIAIFIAIIVNMFNPYHHVVPIGALFFTPVAIVKDLINYFKVDNIIRNNSHY